MCLLKSRIYPELKFQTPDATKNPNLAKKLPLDPILFQTLNLRKLIITRLGPRRIYIHCNTEGFSD